jgi:hypothetical protein
LDTIAKEYNLYESEGDAAAVTDYISEELGSSNFQQVFDSLKRLKQNYSLVYHNAPTEFDRIEKIAREQLAKTGIELPAIEPTILTPRKVPTPPIKEQSPPRFDPQPVISIERETKTIATPEKEPMVNIPIPIQPVGSPPVLKSQYKPPITNLPDSPRSGPSNNLTKWAIAFFAIGLTGWMFGNLTSKNSANFSPDSGIPGSSSLGSSSQSISQRDALDLINRWLEAKKTIFAPPYDRQIGSAIMTGKAYKDNIQGPATNGDRFSSREELQNAGQSYSYGKQSIDSVRDFQLDGNRATVDVTVTEERSFNGGSFRRRQSDFRYYIERDGGDIKIYHYCKITGDTCRGV